MGDRRFAEFERTGDTSNASDALRQEAFGPETARANPRRVEDLYNRLNVNPSTDKDDPKFLTRDELTMAIDNHQQSGYTALTAQEKEVVYMLKDEFDIARNLSYARGEDNDGISLADLQTFVDKNTERLWRRAGSPRSEELGNDLGQFFKLANCNLSSDRHDPQYLTEKELSGILEDDRRSEERLLTVKQREMARMLLADFDRVRKFSQMRGEDNDGISFYDLKLFAENNKGQLEAIDRDSRRK